MSQKLKTLLKNDNFVNNQNYIFNHSKKKTILSYAYSRKRKGFLFLKKEYYFKNINTDKYRTIKLNKGDYGVVEKLIGVGKIKIFLLKKLYYIMSFFGFLLFILLFFCGGNVTDVVMYNGYTGMQSINLLHLNVLDRLNTLKIFIFIPSILFITFFINEEIIKYTEKKYYLFQLKPYSSKIIIYKKEGEKPIIKMADKYLYKISYLLIFMLLTVTGLQYYSFGKTTENLCLLGYSLVNESKKQADKTLEEKLKITNISKDTIRLCKLYLKESQNISSLPNKKNIRLFFKIKTNNKSKAEILRYIGDIYLKGLLDNDMAKKYYLKAIAAKQSDYASYDNILSIFDKTYKNTRNLKDLDELLKFSEKSFTLDNNRFRQQLLMTYEYKIFYAKQNNNNELVQKYGEKSLELDTINFGMNYVVGKNYLDIYNETKSLKIFNKAEKTFQEMLNSQKWGKRFGSLSEKHTKAHYNLGLLYYYAGMYDNNIEKINNSIEVLSKGLKEDYHYLIGDKNAFLPLLKKLYNHGFLVTGNEYYKQGGKLIESYENFYETLYKSGYHKFKFPF